MLLKVTIFIVVIIKKCYIILQKASKHDNLLFQIHVICGKKIAVFFPLESGTFQVV